MGIVSFIAVIVLALAPLFAAVEIDFSAKGKVLNKDSIRGIMTFREVEVLTGVPSNYIFWKLHLSESTTADKWLGSLKNKYGFEIYDIKKIVKDYQNR